MQPLRKRAVKLVKNSNKGAGTCRKEVGEALIPSEIEMSMGYSAGLMDATKAEGSGLPFENFQTGPQSFDFSGGDSAVPDPNRWRELFPLPASPLPVHASGSSTCSRRRRAKVRTRVNEANEIVRCLNEMYHPRKKSYDIETPGPTFQPTCNL